MFPKQIGEGESICIFCQPNVILYMKFPCMSDLVAWLSSALLLRSNLDRSHWFFLTSDIFCILACIIHAKNEVVGKVVGITRNEKARAPANAKIKKGLSFICSSKYPYVSGYAAYC